MEFYFPQREFCVSSINTAFLLEAHENFYFNGEMHNFWEMVYCLNGSFTVSEDEKTYMLSKGQVVFHKPMEFHRLWSQNGQSAKLIIMSFSCTKDKMIHQLGDGVFNLDVPLQKKLEEIYEELQGTFNFETYPSTKGDCSNLKENITIFNFELLLLNILSEINPITTQSGNIGARNYKTILKVMKKHIDENLSVDEIARLCLLSTCNLKKTFKIHAGCGVREHYNKLRIIRACDLLRKGTSIGEVSAIMNFSSPNYFTTFFKKEVGVAPGVYASNPKLFIDFL